MVATDNLRIEFEWQDPAGAKSKELRATWASLSILVGDQRVTELLDNRTRSVRTSAFLPLFPLAEWIADNWWFLHAEVAGPRTEKSIEYDRRHNIRWAREGFVLPSLRFVPLGEHIALHWLPSEIPDAAIRFLSAGNALIRIRDFSDRLREFVNAVVTRLDDSGVTDTTLHEQWTEIIRTESDEEAFCHAAARLGSDPYAINGETEAEIVAASETIRPELLSEFLSLASLDRIRDQAEELKNMADEIADDTDDFDALATIRESIPPFERGSSPWEAGYRFATGLRAALNHRGWKSRTLESLANHLRIDDVDRCIIEQNHQCTFFDGLAGRNQLNNPKFMIPKQREDAKQFAFCRALFEHLTASDEFALVSRLRTERQQMNRAFAAEFLAPHEMLRNDLSAESVGEEEIEDIASDYGVSTFVIRHQIENHRLANVSLD